METNSEQLVDELSENEGEKNLLDIIKSHCIKLVSILKGSGGALLRIVWENLDEDKLLSQSMEGI